MCQGPDPVVDGLGADTLVRLGSRSITYNQMVVEIPTETPPQRSDDDVADELFHALADATRRDIVRRTMVSEHSVSALARMYPMSFAAVQKHVVVLTRAGLVTKEARGREQIVRCDIATVHTAQRLLDQLEQVWRDRLGRFGSVLAES